MMESTTFWEDPTSVHRHVKFERERETSHPCKEERSVFRCCEGNLNFATIATSEDDEYSSYQKKKVSRDPMSHRIIEKRRRDRMNNCLADLSRLIPADYLKKGRGRIEKTEIIEMAIKHMKHLQAHACHQSETCELAQQQNSEDIPEQHQNGGPIVTEHYRLGYQECLSEAMHFLVEVEGFFAGDPLCVQLINHLQKHCDKILKGDRLNFPRTHNGETASTSSNSSGGGGYSNHNGNIIPSGSSGLSGSPTSGSSSDTGRSEIKDSAMNNNIPQTRNQQIATVPPADIEDGCYEEGLVNLSGPSQLREMLTTSNLTTLQTSHSTTLMTRIPQTTSTMSQHLQPPQSPVHSFSSMQYSSGANLEQTCGSGSVASLYKFKNNIKQRFTAEHHSGAMNSTNSGSDNMVNGKRKRYVTDAVQEFGSVKSMATLSTMRRDSETCSIPSSPASPQPISKCPSTSPSPDIAYSPPLPPPIKSTPNPSHGVPIFALHAKGSFYIPLTLDSDILAPYLTAIGFGFDANGLQNGNTESVVLHPVTISVNFQQTNHQRLNNQQPARQHPNHCSTMSTWKNELNGFVPISRWPVYSPDRN